MDDFSAEMKMTLKDIETSNSQRSTLLEEYFPNMFEEALVPINPTRWPAFLAGSASTSQMPELGDKIRTPFENLVVAKEYLETSKSDIQWRARAWQVAEDTTTINFSCEFGRDPGSFGAGIASNKIADGYMDEMITTCATLNNQEKLNEEIFKQVAREKGLDPEIVRGTGVVREFVPSFMQGDFCDRPERNARPFDDDSGHGPLEEGIIFDSKNDALDPSGDSIFESSSSSEGDTPNLWNRFFGLFGGGGDPNMCPVDTAEYPTTDSSLMENIWSMFSFFVPEGGGGSGYCPDPSKMMPPSPYLSDLGYFPGQVFVVSFLETPVFSTV